MAKLSSDAATIVVVLVCAKAISDLERLDTSKECHARVPFFGSAAIVILRVLGGDVGVEILTDSSVPQLFVAELGLIQS